MKGAKAKILRRQLYRLASFKPDADLVEFFKKQMHTEMVSLSDADAARLARLLEWIQKPAGEDIRTRERQRMAGLLAKKIKRKMKDNEDKGNQGDAHRG